MRKPGVAHHHRSMYLARVFRMAGPLQMCDLSASIRCMSGAVIAFAIECSARNPFCESGLATLRTIASHFKGSFERRKSLLCFWCVNLLRISLMRNRVQTSCACPGAASGGLRRCRKIASTLATEGPSSRQRSKRRGQELSVRIARPRSRPCTRSCRKTGHPPLVCPELG